MRVILVHGEGEERSEGCYKHEDTGTDRRKQGWSGGEETGGQEE